MRRQRRERLGCDGLLQRSLRVLNKSGSYLTVRYLIVRVYYVRLCTRKAGLVEASNLYNFKFIICKLILIVWPALDLEVLREIL